MAHFTPEGDPTLFKCSCGSDQCTSPQPTPKLLSLLNAARDEAGIPFFITSGPRCEWWNKKVGGVSTSEHLTGEGADVSCTSSSARLKIIKAALGAGVTRIGIGNNFIHLGVSEDKAQHVIWLY